MKIRRSQLEQIIREELASHIKGMMMEGDAEERYREKGERKPGLPDADQDRQQGDKEGDPPLQPQVEPQNTDRGKTVRPPDDNPEQDEQLPSSNNTEVDPGVGGEPDLEPPPTEDPTADQPAEDDPADSQLSQQAAGDQDDADGTGIGDQVAGNEIQSVTHHPDNEMMPGNQMIELQFQGHAKPLRIFVSPTGKVFFQHGGGPQNTL